MNEMKGNPYFSKPNDSRLSRGIQAETQLNAVAYELRTANLLALAGDIQGAADTPGDYAKVARLRREAARRLGEL